MCGLHAQTANRRALSGAKETTELAWLTHTAQAQSQRQYRTAQQGLHAARTWSATQPAAAWLTARTNAQHPAQSSAQATATRPAEIMILTHALNGVL